MPQAGKVSFGSKGNITDITNPDAPISIDGGATFLVTMSDGSGPNPDKASIVLFKKSGGVWFSSAWDDYQGRTVEKPMVGGGNVTMQ